VARVNSFLLNLHIYFKARNCHGLQAICHNAIQNIRGKTNIIQLAIRGKENTKLKKKKEKIKRYLELYIQSYGDQGASGRQPANQLS
jgi:hypothetical protein